MTSNSKLAVRRRIRAAERAYKEWWSAFIPTPWRNYGKAEKKKTIIIPVTQLGIPQVVVVKVGK